MLTLPEGPAWKSELLQVQEFLERQITEIKAGEHDLSLIDLGSEPFPLSDFPLVAQVWKERSMNKTTNCSSILPPVKPTWEKAIELAKACKNVILKFNALDISLDDNDAFLKEIKNASSVVNLYLLTTSKVSEAIASTSDKNNLKKLKEFLAACNTEDVLFSSAVFATAMEEHRESTTEEAVTSSEPQPKTVPARSSSRRRSSRNSHETNSTTEDKTGARSSRLGTRKKEEAEKEDSEAEADQIEGTAASPDTSEPASRRRKRTAAAVVPALVPKRTIASRAKSSPKPDASPGRRSKRIRN